MRFLGKKTDIKSLQRHKQSLIRDSDADHLDLPSISLAEGWSHSTMSEGLLEHFIQH